MCRLYQISFCILVFLCNVLSFITPASAEAKFSWDPCWRLRCEYWKKMKEIAKRLGVSETTVYNWEIRNRKPYRRTEEKLKAILVLHKKIPV